MAVPVESAGKLDNYTNLYQQLYLFNTCAATLTFMTEYDVPSKINVFIRSL